MPTQYYLPSSDDERNTWLQNFTVKLPQYASKYNISEETVKALQNCCEWFTAILAYQKQFTTFLSNVTAFKNGLRNGVGKNAILSPLTVPAPELPKSEIEPGIFEQVATVVNAIKGSRNYAVADGKDLGIEGAAIAPPDPATLMPVLRVGLAAGGHPNLKWKKQGMSQLEICVDRGKGQGWEALAISTQSRYVDTHELPAPGQSAVWKYRAIYRQKDQPAGQWSNGVQAVVAG